MKKQSTATASQKAAQKNVSLMPLYNRVVIRPLEAKKETQSPSGFILPEQHASQSGRGEVVAVGPGRVSENGTRIPMTVAVGDVVVFAAHLADEVTIDGQNYSILNEEHISAIIK